MKRFLMTLFLLCISSMAHANLHPDAGLFGLRAELLYLQPNINALQFGVEAVSDSEVKVLFNHPDYKPAYRVEGVYAIDCQYDIHVRYTNFNSGSVKRSVSSSFQAPNFFTGTLQDKSSYRYYAIEALFGKWLFSGCDFDFELGIGLLYSKIKFKEKTTVSNPRADLFFVANRVSSTFWGVGPELALNFEYLLPMCFGERFSFVADVRGALLQSQTKQSSVIGSPNPVDSLKIGSNSIRGVVPMADSRLGLNWKPSWNCISASIEAGYEWIYYQRAVGANNISFQGPYLAFNISF